MAKRRGHGEGSVYQRKDGRWVGSISLEGRKRKYIYRDTKKEVLEELRTALHQQQQGALVTGPQQKVEQFLTHWLENIQKPTIRPRSYIYYRDLLHKHILPAIGHLQLRRLSPEHLEALYAQKLAEGLSASTVHSMHTVLHKALGTAVRRHLLMRNVCNEVSLPRKTRYELHPFNPEQAQPFLAAVADHRLKALYILALATGMRLGELLGLKWQDINLAESTLQVRRTLSYVNKIGYRENEPKTQQSRRLILLPHFVAEELKAHRARQTAERLKLGALWENKDLVFCDPTGGYLNPTSSVQKNFHAALKKAGLPNIRFHDLRHSAATLLLGMGVHPKIVQEILGHSNIGMTMNTYSHVLPTMQKEAMEKVNTFLQGQQ